MKTYSNIDYDNYSDLNEYDIDALNQWISERELETEQWVEYTYNQKEAK